MKAFTLSLLGALALLCWPAGSLLAQSQEAEGQGVIIISKTEREDGTVERSEQRIRPGEDAKAALQQLQKTLGEKSELHLLLNEAQIPTLDSESGEEVFFFRSAKKTGEGEEPEIESLKIFLHGEGLSEEESFMRGLVKPHHRGIEESKVAFLGVYPADAEDGVGVKLTRITTGGPAETAGLLAGDMLLAVAGHATNGSAGLRATLSKLEPGETVPVRVRRGSEELELLLTLGSQRHTRWVRPEIERDPCKVFIGVTSSGSATNTRGVKVIEIIPGTPAEAAGLESGDIILALDGIAVSSHQELLAERNKHQPGEAFLLSVLRAGQEMRIEARFTACDPAQEAPAPAPSEVPQQPEPPAMEPFDNTLELEEYKAFPNPAFSYFNLQFRAAAVPTFIQLTDVNGRVVFQRQLNKFDGYFNEEILLKDAAPGLLTLTIRQGDKLVSKQIMMLNRA
jgi:hypothetical protein